MSTEIDRRGAVFVLFSTAAFAGIDVDGRERMGPSDPSAYIHTAHLGDEGEFLHEFTEESVRLVE